MKKIIVFILLIFSSLVKAQSYEYNFTLQGVDNLGSAKIVTDDLRGIFKTYPNFNDSTDSFIFMSEVFINNADFSSIMSSKGYSVLSFKINEAIKEEEK